MTDEKEKKIKKLSVEELSAFSGQISLMTRAGLSVLDGLELMRKDSENSDEAAILDQMLESYRSSASLSRAMEASGVFPSYMTGMVRTGEATGNLDQVMERMELHYQRESELRTSIRQAVLYPILLSIMVTAVILILIIQVMPMFDRVFQELGSSLTGLPLVLSRLGRSLSGSGFILIVLVLAIAVALLLLGRGEHGAALLQKLPGFQSVRNEEAASRFAAHMALVLSSGLPVEDGLDMAQELTDDPDFQKKLEDCRKRMEEGETFAESLKDSKIFSGLYAQLAETGSRTGTMDEAMEKVADLYQSELDSAIDAHIARLEPALVIIMSVIVGGILLSVMVPLISILSAV